MPSNLGSTFDMNKARRYFCGYNYGELNINLWKGLITPSHDLCSGRFILNSLQEVS